MRCAGACLVSLAALLVVPAAARAADAIVVDHTCADLRAVPESAILQAKAGLHIAYGHTSHGSQLISGMGTSGGAQLDAFMTANGSTPGLYRWNAGGTGGALDLRDRPFSGAQDLGNPNRTAWAAATRTWLAAHAETNVVIWSWCGQAATSIADIDIYLTLMEGLIADYPEVHFVFMTGHLDGSGATGALHLANEHIRDHCRTEGRVLYDFADIESYDPEGQTNYLPLLANDNCDYDGDGNGSRESNWAVAWQDAYTLGADWWASGAAHSQHLNGNRKGYAAWHLWARLAGWEPGGSPPPPPPAGPAPDVGRMAVEGGRRQTCGTVRLDVAVEGPATGCRAWEDLPDAVPPDFTPGAPVAGVYRDVAVDLSTQPGLPARRTILFQATNDGAVSGVRSARVTLLAPRVRKVFVRGGRKRTAPDLLLDVTVKGDAAGYRVWEDVPGAVPPEFTPGAPIDGAYEGVPLTLSGDPGLPSRRVVRVQVQGEMEVSKPKRVVLRLR